MRTKKPLLYYATLAFVLMIMSCEHNFNNEEPKADADYNSLVSEAKLFFNQNLLKKSNAKGEAPFDSFLPAEWRDKKPQWNKAVTFKSEGKDVIEVPLLYGTVDPVYKISSDNLNEFIPVSARNGTSKALFFKQKNGTIRAYIMKLIATSDYYTKNKKEKKYKNVSFATASKDFSGVMLLSSWDERLLTMYQFKEGKIVAATVSKNPKTSSKGRGCVSQQRCGWWCISFLNACCTPEEDAYNPTGYCCGNGDEHRVCGPSCVETTICYPDPQPTEPYDPYNPGTNPNENPTTVDVVVDPNLDDCFKGVISAITDERLKNRLTSILQSAFGSNNGSRNLTFRAGNADGSIGAFDANGNIIYLDASKRGNNSNEYVAAVIFHEMAHMVISEFRDSFLTPSTYDQHVQIFQSMVNNIKDGLKEVYP